MTVDHYAEARERAIDAMAEVIFRSSNECRSGVMLRAESVVAARAALDALLAAKLSTECEVCFGKGWVQSSDGAVTCSYCTDGRIEGGPLVILAPIEVGRWEQWTGAVYDPTGKDPDRARVVGKSPVYRERPVQEEK